jgi:hypothetical protein
MREQKEFLVSAIAGSIDKLRELDQDRQRAWNEYYGSLRDLAGDEYEQVELEAWDSLQGELRRIERRRRLLTVAASR